jgi:hypothetical protein
MCPFHFYSFDNASMQEKTKEEKKNSSAGFYSVFLFWAINSINPDPKSKQR